MTFYNPVKSSTSSQDDWTELGNNISSDPSSAYPF